MNPNLYTITTEHAGQAAPMHVVRFGPFPGAWLNLQSSDQQGARQLLRWAAENDLCAALPVDFRATLLASLRAFAESRPGFDYRDYGDITSYRADLRRAAQQLADARALLAYVDGVSGITHESLTLADVGGRLTPNAAGKWEYCVGQYYPTEYRAAVCRLLASVIWELWREGRSADDMRRKARDIFGRGLANRYFN